MVHNNTICNKVKYIISIVHHINKYSNFCLVLSNMQWKENVKKHSEIFRT
jgi:hypothetical protein